MHLNQIMAFPSVTDGSTIMGLGAVREDRKVPRYRPLLRSRQARRLDILTSKHR